MEDRRGGFAAAAHKQRNGRKSAQVGRAKPYFQPFHCPGPNYSDVFSSKSHKQALSSDDLPPLGGTSGDDYSD
jgi:hypothetical protein